MELGDRIREARRSMGLTQKSLAEILKKGYSTVQKYEMNLAVPPLDILSKISEMSGFSLEYLTGRSDVQREQRQITGDSSADRYGAMFAQVVASASHRAEVREDLTIPAKAVYPWYVDHFAEEAIKRLESDLYFLVPEITDDDEAEAKRKESIWNDDEKK